MEIAKSVGFNSPLVAALALNLTLMDIPWLVRGSSFNIKYLFADYLICHEETVHVCGQEKRTETAPLKIQDIFTILWHWMIFFNASIDLH